MICLVESSGLSFSVCSLICGVLKPVTAVAGSDGLSVLFLDTAVIVLPSSKFFVGIVTTPVSGLTITPSGASPSIFHLPLLSFLAIIVRTGCSGPLIEFGLALISIFTTVVSSVGGVTVTFPSFFWLSVGTVIVGFCGLAVTITVVASPSTPPLLGTSLSVVPGSFLSISIVKFPSLLASPVPTVLPPLSLTVTVFPG